MFAQTLVGLRNECKLVSLVAGSHSSVWNIVQCIKAWNSLYNDRSFQTGPALHPCSTVPPGSLQFHEGGRDLEIPTMLQFRSQPWSMKYPVGYTNLQGYRTSCSSCFTVIAPMSALHFAKRTLRQPGLSSSDSFCAPKTQAQN